MLTGCGRYAHKHFKTAEQPFSKDLLYYSMVVICARGSKY